MIIEDQQTEQMLIVIPLKGMEDLRKYKNGILGVLSEIRVGECKPNLKEHIKIMYELLGHL